MQNSNTSQKFLPQYIFPQFNGSFDENIDDVFFAMYQDRLREHWKHGFSREDSLLIEKDLLRIEYANFVMGLGSWKSFITLTFRDPVSGEKADKMFRGLLFMLNRRLYGKQYTQFVGHSYCSYCVGVEFQRRDVIHFHVLVDRPVDFQFIHSWWKSVAGFAWITPPDDLVAVISYVTKYVVKDGELRLFTNKKFRLPHPCPIWWT